MQSPNQPLTPGGVYLSRRPIENASFWEGDKAQVETHHY